MNHEDGTDPWLSQRPETPPWDAAEYNQLISSGPLLPLLEHYAGIGTMHDKQRRNSCHVRDDEDVILLMSYNLFLAGSYDQTTIRGAAWQVSSQGGNADKCTGNQLQLANVANQGNAYEKGTYCCGHEIKLARMAKDSRVISEKM